MGVVVEIFLLFLVTDNLASCNADPTRIIGGDLTTIDQYTSLVQVESFDPWILSWYQSCAANILTTRFVLSAAHCFSGLFYLDGWRRIRAGTSFQSLGGQISNVEQSTNHPSWGAIGIDGDISVIFLETPLIHTPVIQQATIIAQDVDIPDNAPVKHVGWGHTISGDVTSGSSQLRDVTVFTINNNLCAGRYGARGDIVTKNMICVGILDTGGKDACQGDSGGLLYYGSLLVGIVSWGYDCGDEYYPGVNTRIASYTDWIRASTSVGYNDSLKKGRRVTFNNFNL